MKICIAQTMSIKNNIQKNIENHQKWIEVATAHYADMIIFPELSLTSYEPTLAKVSAITFDDNRLNGFQKISDAKQVIIGIGAPTKSGSQIHISMIIFQPQTYRQLYSKKYLHPDEEDFFVSGNNAVDLLGPDKDCALAICYELSIPEHAENAYKQGAKIYFASVAKIPRSIEKAISRLTEIAKQYSMLVCMANCVGEFDGCESGGKSSVWNTNGILLGQLDNKNEGLLIFDTTSHEVIKIF